MYVWIWNGFDIKMSAYRYIRLVRHFYHCNREFHCSTLITVCMYHLGISTLIFCIFALISSLVCCCCLHCCPHYCYLPDFYSCCSTIFPSVVAFALAADAVAAMVMVIVLAVFVDDFRPVVMPVTMGPATMTMATIRNAQASALIQMCRNQSAHTAAQTQNNVHPFETINWGRNKKIRNSI